MHLLEKHIRAVFKKAEDGYRREENEQPHRPYFINASQLPYCGLRRFLQITTGVRSPLNARGRYYTHVGTSTHTVLQEVFGGSGRILGNWKCKQCSHLEKLAVKPTACKECGSTRMEYEEIEILLDGWALGHIDGVFEATGAGIEGYWVIDYKTTSHKKAGDKKNKIQASLGYKLQQRTYVSALPKTHKIKPRGWVLLYVSRDNPFAVQSYVIEEMTPLARRRHYQEVVTPWIEQHKVSVAAATFKEAKALYPMRLCKTKADHKKYFEYEGCQFKALCVDNTRERTLSYLRDAIDNTDHALPIEDNLPKAAKKVMARNGIP